MEVSIYLRYLYQDLGIRGQELLKRFPEYPKTSVYRHAKMEIGAVKYDGRHKNTGRRKKLTERDERNIFRKLEHLRGSMGTFSSKEIQKSAGLSEKDISNRTVRRCLNARGYQFLQCRKKGLLTAADLKKRLKFARTCKKLLSDKFWKEGVSFYLDGTGFAHKVNPSKYARTQRTRAWRKRGEGLTIHCTAKGKKEGTGGRVAKFMVAIAFGKGVIKCQQYEGNINGELFAEFVQQEFPEMFENSSNPKGKLFLQDGDPSQNSKVSQGAMDSVGCKLFKIPPRSPDLNPIENVFHLARKQLNKDAIAKNIEHETYKEFSRRVKSLLLNFSSVVIDRTIGSMGKRICEVIKMKGQRTKY